MFGRKVASLIFPVVTFGLAAALSPTQAFASGEPTVQATGATTETITTTIVFDIKHPEKLQRYIRDTVTPGSPHYRDFLTVDEFVRHYAPPPGQLRKVERYLESYGLTIDKVFDDHLAITVSGPASAFELAFQTQLGNFVETEPAQHPHRRHHFHRPKNPPHLPKLLSDNGVLAIVGLSNEYQFKPMHTSTAQAVVGANLKVAPGSNTIATGTPGQFTVADVANLYNINPLYDAGTTGAGTTIGVATYAAFLPEDAYTYWDIIGLEYKPARIGQVHINGGAPFGAAVGSGETSLDVEQSGGLAPFADMLVYDAPNSSNGGLDMFYQIVSENRVDAVSYSWGLPEIFYYPELNGGTDATDTMQALNQAFMEAAAQGISIFAASGDSGAYDTNRNLPASYFTTPLTVDWPASSPYITAAGGTTLPVSLVGGCGDGVFHIDVPARRAWAWDYLSDFYQTCYGLTPVQAGVFSVGDGGGVSVYWQRPWYQDGVVGVERSAAGQSLIEEDVDPSVFILGLKSGFRGRNVPDISMNADPYTGYLVYSSADGGLISGYGGTSFVAPQLNGIVALIDQASGSRVGLLNPQLYRLLHRYGYGPDSPFVDITDGDNWYWQAASGYEPASGVGVPNVAQLAALLSVDPRNDHSHGH